MSPPRPPLCLSPEIADLVRGHYAAAGAILEYGSGGSTALAAERGVPCLSVENDRRWARSVRHWIDAACPGHRVTLRTVYIGPVRKWGRPSQTQAPLWRWRYPAYPRTPWRPLPVSPDVILIDGRFRPACFLTALARIDRPATILWDDYLSRPDYRVVERHLAPARMVDRMAVFEAEPGRLGPDDLAAADPLFTDPE